MVLTGPPAAGNSEVLLDALRAAIATAAPARLIVPTATMAEHLRNRLARQGLAFSPGRVVTLSKFTGRWCAGGPVSPAVLGRLVAAALEQAGPEVFREVAGYPGFRAGVAALIEEAAMAGGTPELLESATGDAFQVAFAGLWREVELDLARRGLSLRAGMLKRAAGAICSGGALDELLLFDGFFALGSRELDLILALASRAEVRIALPRWPGSESSLRALEGAGFVVRDAGGSGEGTAKRVLVTPPTLDQEAEEIARRVMAESARGRRFGDMGVIVRGDCPQTSALRTALERFGIPARFYFAEPLAAHPAMGFVADLIASLEAGWDWGLLGQALRRSHSGLGAGLHGDRFDFDLRARLPGRGLEGLELPPGVANALRSLSSWTTGSRLPAEWARLIGALPASFPPRAPQPSDFRNAEMWRARAAAIAQFREVVEEIAAVFDAAEPVGFAPIWAAVRDALRDTELRVSSHRRNAVHVMDAYEARQWRLPVVFLAGMLERQFPRYQPGTPLLPDETRLRLQARGAHLRTSAERQQEERFLFETSVSCASEALVASYPRFNEKGDENLPSFFLRDLGAQAEASRSARPRPAREPFTPVAAAVEAPELLRRIADRHSKIGPTSIESFLQCPFQFFAAKSLRLEPPPVAPDERFDLLLQGSIVHLVLDRMNTQPKQNLEEVFGRVFEEEARKARLREGFLTESIRLELRRDLEAFLAREAERPAATVETERRFEMPLAGDLVITGRIDRLDEDERGRLLVIDYKYSSRISDKVEAAESGERVQAGLYLAAVRDVLRREPAGMLYCSLKKGVQWDGWQISAPALGGSQCSGSYLEDLMATARERTLAALAEIRGGRVAPHPADPSKCRYCEYADICRNEEAGAPLAMPAVGG